MPDLQYCVSNKRRFGEFAPGCNRPVMAVIEITNRCNMACPICFSDANNKTFEPSLFEIRVYLQNLLEVTKTPIKCAK